VCSCAQLSPRCRSSGSRARGPAADRGACREWRRVWRCLFRFELQHGPPEGGPHRCPRTGRVRFSRT
jgi:hypothetical protein